MVEYESDPAYQMTRNQAEMLGSAQGVGSSFGSHHAIFSPITSPNPSWREVTRAVEMRATPTIPAPSITSLTPIVKFCPAHESE